MRLLRIIGKILAFPVMLIVTVIQWLFAFLISFSSVLFYLLAGLFLLIAVLSLVFGVATWPEALRAVLAGFIVFKEKAYELATKGQELAVPEDIVKDPYVFEFLGIPENKPVLESDLEKALVRQIEDFMLELGRGFMFVGTQQRVTLNNTHYYVDMVFYNKELHAYVLIELKTVKLMPEAVGQLNMYLNYYAAEVNEPGDNPPIGIILCTDKDNVSAEYALGGLSNNIFASTYTYVIPEKEKLIAQVEAVLEKWEDKEE